MAAVASTTARRELLLRAMGYQPYRLRQDAAGTAFDTAEPRRWVAVAAGSHGSDRAADALLANIFAAIGVENRDWQRSTTQSRAQPPGKLHWLVFGDLPPALAPAGAIVRAAPLADLLGDPEAKRALWHQLRPLTRRTAG